MNLTNNDIRKKVLHLLRNQKQEQRLSGSLLIANKLFKTREYLQAKTVLFYASFDGEVETNLMIEQAIRNNKKVGLPKINKMMNVIEPYQIQSLKEDLKQGPFGITEPNQEKCEVLNLKQVDLIVVPAVAYDTQNNRLGRGGGYYDRFLSSISAHTKTIGLAFDFQLLDTIPEVQAHDIPVDLVLTNKPF